ncbi:MAG: histidine phosphatase family protein [Prevotella sp.]|nr:histidine phosphatase family protein [Prevotella sp.]
MILLLTRHSETLGNVNHIMQGQTHGELTEKGIQQAKETALKLKDAQIDIFLSSDLKRAIDTCNIIAAPHSGMVITTTLLRERDWGGFTGRYIPELKDVPWPDNIESLDSLLNRAARFIRYVKENYPNKTVLAVGHGIINKAIQAVLLNKTISDITHMENAEIREYQL